MNNQTATCRGFFIRIFFYESSRPIIATGSSRRAHPIDLGIVKPTLKTSENKACSFIHTEDLSETLIIFISVFNQNNNNKKIT